MRQNIVFFLSFGLLQLLGLIGMLFFSKQDLFFFVYRNRSPFLNDFFRYLTHFGDGLFFVIIIVILCFISLRYAFIGLASFILTSIITHLLKGIIFIEAARPKKFFEGVEEILAVTGSKLYSNASFPSGHTVTAFAVFTLIALITPQKQMGWLLCVIAAFIGFSRVYLAQHFFGDIYAGAWIGTLCSLLFYFLFTQKKTFIDKWSWPAKTILTLKDNGQA